MKKEYTGLELFGAVIMLLILSIPLSFYYAWCAFKIIQWYNIPAHLTIVQLFGISSVLSFMGLAQDTDKSEKELSSMISTLLGRAFAYSIVLFILYITHFFVY